MSWLKTTLTSSIGRKVIMALSGLFLITFLAVHLAGNIPLILQDEALFNQYTKFMSTNGLIRVLEIGLVVGFGFHIVTAFMLTGANKAARPVKYAYEKPSANSSWFSRNMVLSGVIVLLFLGLHLFQFYFGYKFMDAPEPAMVKDANGVMVENLKDMYGLVYATLGNPIFMGIYVLTFVLLAFHLNHGFQSAFQTLGVNHPKYTPMIKGLGTLIAFALPLGFVVVAVGVFLIHNNIL